ncbi:MAG TPA: YdeI/OmpD-associated family protein, partial [Vicinamibacterales bacterium]|nr:YdeI/OmpD-associated family protein [Vicinamibacterales bacterium]
GLTYRDALDAALAYGWIDGVRRGIDPRAYSIRFTPRKTDSYWSAVNTKRFRALQKLGQIAPPGLSAFERRDAKRRREYSFERAQPAVFDRAAASQLRANRAAAAFFDAQPPGYRKVATYWVMNAKTDETRRRRLAILIGRSGRGLRIDPLKPNTP